MTLLEGKTCLRTIYLGTCTGRLFSFNLETNELRTIAAELCFPNGVQLTNNEKTLIVTETTRYRVSWIDVASGTKKHVLALPGTLYPCVLYTTGCCILL